MEILRECWSDDHQFLLLTQDCFLTQLVLEPTRDGIVLNLIWFSQKPLGSSDHKQIHFTIKVKTWNTYKKTMEEELQQRQT